MTEKEEEDVNAEQVKKAVPPASVLIAAIVVVGGLVAFALSQGHDGVILSAGLAIIGAIAGVKLPEFWTKR